MIRQFFKLSSLPLLGMLMFAWNSAHAYEDYYKRECNGCHAEREGITCKGCHYHGTHASLAEVGSINLVAKTDRDSYAAGDDITVTLTGGNQMGWVGVNLYDEKGVPLGHVRSELPATITTRAYEGMSKVYVAWLGFEFDTTGAKYGDPVTGTISEGMRELFRAGVHKDQPHFEEIVASNTFVVGPGSVSDTSNDGSNNDTGSGDGSNNTGFAGKLAGEGGGGAFDFVWILGGAVALAFLRRRDYWKKKTVSVDTESNKNSNAAPV